MAGLILHFAGVPATGKSLFCRYLAREHAFAHYDMECWPKGWPDPQLHPIWERSRQEFVAELRRLHENVAIDWGFPVQFRSLVAELQSCGVRLVWFTGNSMHAKKLYQERGGLPLENFDRQIREIMEAGLPTGLGATVVNTLTPEGSLRPMVEIYGELFTVA